MHARPRFQPLPGILGLDPHFHGRTVRIQCRAHDRYLPVHYFVFPRNRNGGRISHLEQFGLVLRNVRAGYDLGCVHQRDEWSAGRCHLAGVQGAVGHHAINGAADFGIAELCGGAFVFSLRCRKLAGRGLYFLLVPHRQQRIPMPLRQLVLIARIGQVHRRLVQFFARQRALLEELLAAGVYLLLRFQSLGRRLQVRFRFLNFFRKGSRCRSGVSSFSLLIGALVLYRRRRQIAIFQNRQQLSFAHPGAALHVKGLHGRADFRHQRRLL